MGDQGRLKGFGLAAQNGCVCPPVVLRGTFGDRAGEREARWNEEGRGVELESVVPTKNAVGGETVWISFFRPPERNLSGTVKASFLKARILGHSSDSSRHCTYSL